MTYGVIPPHPNTRSHRQPVFVADVAAQHHRLPRPIARRRLPHFLSLVRLLDQAPPVHLERDHCPASELGRISLPRVVQISIVLGRVVVQPRSDYGPDYRGEGLLVPMLTLVFESLLECLEDGEIVKTVHCMVESMALGRYFMSNVYRVHRS